MWHVSLYIKAEVNKVKKQIDAISFIFFECHVNCIISFPHTRKKRRNNSKMSLNSKTPQRETTTRSSQPSPRDVQWSKPIRDHLEVPLQCTMGYSLHPGMTNRLWVCGCVSLSKSVYVRIGTVYVCNHVPVSETGRDTGQHVADCWVFDSKNTLGAKFTCVKNNVTQTHQ